MIKKYKLKNGDSFFLFKCLLYRGQNKTAKEVVLLHRKNDTKLVMSIREKN